MPPEATRGGARGPNAHHADSKGLRNRKSVRGNKKTKKKTKQTNKQNKWTKRSPVWEYVQLKPDRDAKSNT